MLIPPPFVLPRVARGRKEVGVIAEAISLGMRFFK
jgi:hypothetical protein